MRSPGKKYDVRARCAALWEQLYPEVKRPETRLREWYREAVPGARAALDAGCGPGGSIDHAREAPGALTVGLDMDFESLKRNPCVKLKVVGSAESLPFRDGAFDIVAAQYVLEHIENPRAALSEIARVSRPGAQFLFMTTNSSSCLGLAMGLIPRPVQFFIKRRFLKMPEQGLHPVYMRCNSPRKLAHLLRSAGFDSPDFIFIGGPFYFSFSYVLFRIAVLLERITDGALKSYKFYIVGRVRRRD